MHPMLSIRHCPTSSRRRCSGGRKLKPTTLYLVSKKRYKECTLCCPFVIVKFVGGDTCTVTMGLAYHNSSCSF
jgi:hypothetical protein